LEVKTFTSGALGLALEKSIQVCDHNAEEYPAMAIIKNKNFFIV
jgi:hypothetical protein